MFFFTLGDAVVCSVPEQQLCVLYLRVLGLTHVVERQM